MDKATWTLAESKQARAAFDAAYKRAMPAVANGARLVLEVRKERRSDVQSALFHALLGEISNKHLFNGRKLSLDEWKVIFISGHRLATGDMPDMVRGLEGEMLNLRESSARMSTARMTSLIDYVQSWKAMNNAGAE